jgi:hypothetical protein
MLAQTQFPRDPMLDLSSSLVRHALSSAVASLVLAGAPAFAQAPAPLSAQLLEAPRLGVVLKAGVPKHKTRVGWKELVIGHPAAPDLVVLDALPASASKAPDAPTWVLVVSEAKSKASGPRTVDYEDDRGRPYRLRYQGASAHVRAKLYVVRDKSVEIGEFDQDFEDLDAPEKYRFARGRSKEDLVVDPDGLLDYAIVRGPSAGLCVRARLMA